MALTVFAYVLGVSVLEGRVRQMVEGTFWGLMVAVYFSLLFGLPYMIGLLLWPQRRKTRDPG